MPEAWDDALVAHRYAALGDVRLHYVEAGPADGPLVVLLHGFPEFWYSWRHQIPALARAGFRVVAPDQRGYNLSDKPAGVRSYDARILAHDVERLVRACGAARAHAVVGHDWGGGVAWLTAMRHPEVLGRLCVLNCPHPARLLAAFLTARQLRKSWYMFYFQLPFLPERSMAADDFASIRRTFRREPVRPEAFSDDDIQRYVDALSRPGALTAAVNWYRAMFRQDPRRTLAELRQPVAAPTLVLWGERDPHLGAELAEPDPALVPDVRVVRIDDASHWVQVDAYERVNEALLEFLRPERAAEAAA
ncbi:MAG TPA: alpha/beta hydrolase [Myxococcota bacterium]|jgi:pimeloyl-ACP methyl ester carboxylesterase|nr:alpha/beta hydrolase [Myxococcota bacterium]